MFWFSTINFLLLIYSSYIVPSFHSYSAKIRFWKLFGKILPLVLFLRTEGGSFRNLKKQKHNLAHPKCLFWPVKHTQYHIRPQFIISKLVMQIHNAKMILQSHICSIKLVIQNKQNWPLKDKIGIEYHRRTNLLSLLNGGQMSFLEYYIFTIK